MFPNYSEQQILNAIDSLNETNRKIIELRYGLNGNPVTSTKDIAKQLDIKYSTMSVRVVDVRKMLGKRLEKQQPIPEQDSKLAAATPKVEDDRTPVLNAETTTQTEGKPALSSVDNKIQELRESILSNQFGMGNQSYVVDGITVNATVQERECLLAKKDKKWDTLDRSHAIKKNSYVYVLTATTPVKKILSEIVLVRDKKTNEFYNVVYRSKDGEYDLSNMKENELLCYNVEGIRLPFLPSVKEPLASPVIRKKIPTKNNPIPTISDTKPIITELNHTYTEEDDVTLITSRSQSFVDSDFEKHKNQIGKLISMLNDPTEQVTLLLRLGYVRNQIYSEEQIGQFLNIAKDEIKTIMSSGLTNITNISTITLSGIESARQQLTLTEKTK